MYHYLPQTMTLISFGTTHQIHNTLMCGAIQGRFRRRITANDAYNNWVSCRPQIRTPEGCCLLIHCTGLAGYNRQATFAYVYAYKHEPPSYWKGQPTVQEV